MLYKKAKKHINNSLNEKLLGITFDCKLKFNKHIEDIYQKAWEQPKIVFL